MSGTVPNRGFTLYEISSRPWLYELQQKYGEDVVKTIADVPMEELQKLKDNMVYMVWLQGVWKLGEIGLELDRTETSRVGAYMKALPGYTEDDIIGSPYAVVEYVASDQLGGNDALKQFREKLNSLGIKLMLDFVPNHMAVDCKWAEDPEKKDFFILKPAKGYNPDEFMSDGRAHGKDPYCGAWPDTAQLNYWNPKLREAMTENLITIASLCDGIRSDMSMLLLNNIIERTWGVELKENGWTRPETEFWDSAIQKMKAAHPNTILMAEVYWELDAELVRLGFDATYDKILYDILLSRHLDNLRNYISSKSIDFLSHSCHFVENHDEPRGGQHFGSRTVSNAAAAISFLVPGLRLQFHGQWEGKKNRLDVHLRRCADEPVDDKTVQFYQKLNQILGMDIVQFGDWSMKWVDHASEHDFDTWRMVAFQWKYENKYLVVVVNYSEGMGGGHIKLEGFQGSGEIKLKELMSGEEYTRNKQDLVGLGLHVILDPWKTQVFEYTSD